MRAKLINEVADRLRLSKRETALLRYYSGVFGHFKPAIKTIADNTGIDRNKIWEIRAQLHDKGLLYYDKEDRVIYIDWSRLRALASVPQARVKGAIYLEPISRDKIERVKMLRKLGYRWLQDIKRIYIQFGLFEKWPDFTDYACMMARNELQYRQEQQYGKLFAEQILEEQSEMIVASQDDFDYSVMFPDGYDNIPY